MISGLNPATATTHSSANSSRPIFFGNPNTGYTTAFIFRIPDMHARGHKRVYAFLAFSNSRERRAMKAFAFLGAAFRELAAWIQALVEREAERVAQESPVSSGLYGQQGGGPYPNPYQHMGPSEAIYGGTTGGYLTGGGPASGSLGGAYGGATSGFHRRMMAPGVGATSGAALRARGLAELAGLPDFFVQLHGRFVGLLMELGSILAS